MKPFEQIDYEVIEMNTEDAAYAIVLWQLPDDRVAMEVWDVAARMCLDPNASETKMLSEKGVKVYRMGRERALVTAGEMMSERDSER